MAVVPGEAFGAPGYFRMSYALGDDDLVEGVTGWPTLFAEADHRRLEPGWPTGRRTVMLYGTAAGPAGRRVPPRSPRTAVSHRIANRKEHHG